MSTARKATSGNPKKKDPTESKQGTLRAPDIAHVEIDPDSFTISEVELFEDICDFPIDHVAIRKRGKSTRVMLWLCLRRNDPDITLEDLDDVNFVKAVEKVGESSGDAD